jgi:hypothetical protein
MARTPKPLRQSYKIKSYRIIEDPAHSFDPTMLTRAQARAMRWVARYTWRWIRCHKKVGV